MSFKIQNWTLSLLAFIFIGVFTSLGMWQLSRASEKKILLKSFAERTESAPLDVSSLSKHSDLPGVPAKKRGNSLNVYMLRKSKAFACAKEGESRSSPFGNPHRARLAETAGDLRFYRTQLQGTFDNAHSILLDNKIYQGKVGYEVYTPFHVIGLKKPVLVDRGFIPITNSRTEIPAIRTVTGTVTITGMLNLPPTYVALGQMTDTPAHHWPLRVEYIHLAKLSPLLNQSIYPYVLNITPDDAAAFAVHWQAVTMSPEKHMGYALQWFAFALTLLILFVTLNRQKKN